MLTNTALVVVEDAKTGALMINRVAREELPPSSSASDRKTRTPAEKPQKMIKQNSLIALLSGLFALTSAPNFAAEPADRSAVAVSAQETAAIAGRVRNGFTGRYLNNARVSIKGTSLIVYTDQFGAFQLPAVRSGATVMQVFYTDLDLAEIALDVPKGGLIEQNVDLTSVARYGQNPAVVKLSSFVVLAEKEADAQSLAVNEQRFAPNIKNVLSVDAMGAVLGSTVGEFLKYIPGVTAEFDQADIKEISIRGIGSGMTSMMTDGTPVNIAAQSSTRNIDIRSLSLNDYSRVEVTKVPTPSTPADSLAGSINMISKSAFEKSRAQFRYGFTLDANSENVTLKKTPDSNGDRYTSKIMPGFDFEYTWPINNKFGIVVSGMHSSKYNEQHSTSTTYENAGTATGASFSRPYFQSFSLLDGPRHLTRDTFSFKADWRVTPHSVLSVGGQTNIVLTEIASLSMSAGAGTTGSPLTAGGVALSYGDNYTTGATGRGTVTQNPNHQIQNLDTYSGNVNYRFDDGKWRVESGISGSKSMVQRNRGARHYYTFAATMVQPVRVSFTDIGPDRPGTIQVFNPANQLVDIYNIENYRGTTVTDQPIRNRTRIKAGNFNLRRRLDVFPFPTALQIGGLRKVQTLDIRTQNIAWTFNGPDGNPATIESLAPYQAQVYKNQDSHYGFKNIPWLSGAKLWSAAQANPLLVTQTPAQVVAQENFRRTNSEHVQESISAAYFQAEAGFLNNRLRLLTGVRFESTTDRGEGALSDPNAVFVRNANGSFAQSAPGVRIRKPDAPAAGSLAELDLILKERGAKADRTYSGYYPSLHLTYNIKENFHVRAAYARTYGRPNFLDIIPRAVINEANLNEAQFEDPSVIRGSITVRNTRLRPWTSDNFDVSLEYYTPQGGLLSAGVFDKEIKNFFGTAVKVATLADLEAVGIDDSRYVGWNLSTKFNAGDARISGAEINSRHSLRELGPWGKPFTIFANATKLKLEGNRQADFTSFIPLSANWGATFEGKKVTVTARWNYRGKDFRSLQPAFGPDGGDWFKARTSLDLSLGYTFTPRLSMAVSINNVFNVPQTRLRYSPATPVYARQSSTSEYGTNFGVGLRGTF